MLLQNFSKINKRSACVSRCYSIWKNSMSEIQPYVVKEKFDPEKPIKFSTSQASGWNIKNFRTEYDSFVDASWTKTFILGGTYMFWIIYLMYLRPPNDLDEDLEMPLIKRILMIREEQILEKKGKASSAAVKAYEEDLKEIRRLRKKYGYDED